VIEVPIEVPNDVPISQVQFVIALSGLEPFSYIEVYANSEPVLLASGFADENGEFNVTVSLPATLPPGDHSVSVQNTLSDGTTVETTLVAFSVSETGTVGDPATPLADGALTLVVPANAVASFGSPALVDGISVTNGSLGEFSVDDQRIVSVPGWTLTASVGQFSLASNANVTMPASQLGVAPILIGSASTSLGVTLGSATAPGLASYPMVFAQTESDGGIGVTTFDATLILKSPPQLPAGTYNSTFTLTLASK
jgi:methionine-rich copper-binding protein CopC